MMLSHKHIQIGLAVFIAVGSIVTKVIAVNYWAEHGITNIMPWFVPYITIGIGIALCGRLYYEKSRLFSVWIMAIALVWYGFESFAVAGVM